MRDNFPTPFYFFRTQIMDQEHQQGQTLKVGTLYELIGELYVQGKLLQDQVANSNLEIARLRNFLNMKNAGVQVGDVVENELRSVAT